MKNNFFENLKKIEKEYPNFFGKPKKSLVNYISVETSANGNILFKSNLTVSDDLPKEIAEKVHLVLSY